jgi:pyruvate kinase
VLDGTDAVMLSAETATGKYPLKVIQEMDKICRASEIHPCTPINRQSLEREFARADEAIAMSAIFVAGHLDAKAIIAMTESGCTALWMSRIGPNIPIYALTPNLATMGWVTLMRGVEPVEFHSKQLAVKDINRAAVDELVKRHSVKADDLILMTFGDHVGKHGGTNQLKIMRVGNVV